MDSDELMEDGEEVVEDDTEDILGYLTLVPLWLFDLLVGEMPLLQVGLSDPGRRDQRELNWCAMVTRVKGSEAEAAGTGAVRVCVGGSVVGAEDGGVAVLGLRGVDVQAAHLPVCAVHHLHELATP